MKNLHSLAIIALLSSPTFAGIPASPIRPAPAAATPAGAAAAAASNIKPSSATLTTTPHAVNMDASKKYGLGYSPAPLATADTKPSAITKEPNYLGTPVYGAFQIGNGPKSLTFCVIDEPTDPDTPGKIYIDRNQNGDLTDDGPGTWQNVKKTDRGLYYESEIELHASWGNALKEETSGTYSVLVYRYKSTPRTFYARTAAQTGKIELDGKSYNIIVYENNADGLFIIPASNERNRRSIDLLIDINGDGSYSGIVEKTDDKTIITREHYSLASPFKIKDQWYIASISLDGTKLTVGPSAEPGATGARAQGPVERSDLLKAGTVAPDFTLNNPEGKPVKLSDFKGKLVVVDFWATWCGPCQVAMPGLQKTYDKVRSQDVVVLSPCVFDEKPAFDTWIKQHAGKDYTFTFVFDPAGRGDNSVASKLYNVSGIPTQYLIDRQGKVVAAILGSGHEQALIDALKSQGIKIEP